MAAAQERLAAWRAAVGRASGPDASALVDRLRTHLADDLDTPGSLAAVDEWAAADGDDPAAPGLARDAVDALLGVAL
jgi:L-cysteine:1D-myo-inositol 2-amino-2-deoxy-alpha-D-glucopyranoside ligase